MKSEDILKELKDEIVCKMSSIVQESLAQIVQDEIGKSLGKSLMQGEFLRSINKDVRTGLINIYNEINGVKSSVTSGTQEQAKKIFNDTENKLDYIIQSTEEASFEIMDQVEDIQNIQSQNNKIINNRIKDEEVKQKLIERNNLIDYKLNLIMTLLSFQDITGQHIKKIINVLKSIEKVVLDVYVSSGVMMQSKYANPDKDIDEIKNESEQKIKKYIDSQKFNQADVDYLLSQLM
ncbi:MAG: protein phosphatase CheZ [Candidatus Woesearchaeota archaeon]